MQTHSDGQCKRFTGCNATYWSNAWPRQQTKLSSWRHDPEDDKWHHSCHTIQDGIPFCNLFPSGIYYEAKISTWIRFIQRHIYLLKSLITVIAHQRCPAARYQSAGHCQQCWLLLTFRNESPHVVPFKFFLVTQIYFYRKEYRCHSAFQLSS